MKQVVLAPILESKRMLIRMLKRSRLTLSNSRPRSLNPFWTDGEMRNVVFSSTTNNIIAMLGLIMCISLLLAASIVLIATEKVFAAGQFTIESKTNTQKAIHSHFPVTGSVAYCCSSDPASI